MTCLKMDSESPATDRLYRSKMGIRNLHFKYAFLVIITPKSLRANPSQVSSVG